MMTRTKLDSLLQWVEALRKVDKSDGVAYNFGKGSGKKGQRKNAERTRISTRWILQLVLANRPQRSSVLV